MFNLDFAINFAISLLFCFYTASDKIFCAQRTSKYVCAKKSCLSCLKAKFPRFSSKFIAKSRLKLVKNEDGFTLLEILGAVTLLAVSLIPIMLIFYSGTFNTTATAYRNIAADFAQQKIEVVRNMSYDNITTANLPSDSPSSGDRSFTRTVTIVSSPSEIPSTNADIKKITVTVSWVDGSGITRSVSLVTFRSKWL